MTWHTPCGRRILIRAEAVLLKESIATLADMLSVDLHGEGNVSEMGVAAFDCLTGPARLNLLARVAVALLTHTTECAPLTAVSEATIAAVYRQIEFMIQAEIDAEDDSNDPLFWRSQVLKAIGEATEIDEANPELKLPLPESRELEEWEFLVELLRNRILWDHDFDSEAVLADAAPVDAESIRETIGIDDEYFRAVPEDPLDSEIEGIRVTIRRICQA